MESIESVERKIGDGSYTFWAGGEAAAVTEIVEANGVKILMMRHAGGSMEALTETLEPMLCEYGRYHGCKRIMGEGREGWKRVCKRMGYRHAFTIMAKDL